MTRPPPAEAEVTAGLGRAAVAARCAEGPPGSGEQVRGRARPGWAVRSSGAAGGGAPGPEGRAGMLGLRRPCREPPTGSGAPGPRRSPSVQVGRALGGAGDSKKPGGRQSEGCRRGLLKIVSGKPRDLRPAPPCHSGNEAKFVNSGKESSVILQMKKFFWFTQRHFQSE